MRRLHGALILAALSLRCGGGPEGPLAVALSRDPLLGPELTRACLSLYPGEQSCEVLRVSARPGLFQAQIGLGARAEVASTVFRVRAGAYTAAVWAMDAEGRAAGFGCRPGAIEVRDGERADVDIVVRANSDPERGEPCPAP